MSALPSIEQVLTLPASFDQEVEEKFIDENGHMNIGDYFHLGSWAPWLRMTEVATGEDYIGERGLSFFTVEHNIRYLGEMRLGDRFSIHAAFAGRTPKALHAVSFVVDRGRERIACLMEIVYVHISMESRRATAMPADVAAALDADAATYADWVPAVADKLTLRPARPTQDGSMAP